MASDPDKNQWPALNVDNEALLKEIFALLSARVTADAYSSDGSFAAQIATLPPGLRAMAATHWLDISLTLDSITWHFGNFGEPNLVRLTDEGLVELGLDDLVACFREARDLMLPLLAGRTESDGDLYEVLEKHGLREVAEDINRRAWAIDGISKKESVIYQAWVAYARQHPARVFGAWQ